jgi:hypothetical protein
MLSHFLSSLFNNATQPITSSLSLFLIHKLDLLPNQDVFVYSFFDDRNAPLDPVLKDGVKGSYIKKIKILTRTRSTDARQNPAL